jgi:hypothetical protein
MILEVAQMVMQNGRKKSYFSPFTSKNLRLKISPDGKIGKTEKLLPLLQKYAQAIHYHSQL